MSGLPKMYTHVSSGRKKGSKMKKKYRILFFLIGIAGFVFLILSTDPGKEDWQKLITPKLPLILLAMLLLWTVIYLVHCCAYRLVIGPESKKIKLLELLRICVSGFALNDVTPLGMAGGEPYRIMELRRYFGTEKATSVTLTFSVLYIIGHVLLWLTGIVLYLLLGCPGGTFMTVLLLIVMALLLGVCIVFFNNRNSGIILPLLSALGKVFFLKKPVASFLEKKRAQIEEIDSGYVDFRKVSDRFYKAVLCEYGSRVLEGLEYFIIFRYLGEPVSVIGGIVILSMASLVGNLVFIIPMQAGAREGGMAIAIDWLGLDPATGMIGGLLYRMRNIACILIGLLCILVDRDNSAKTEKTPESR